MIAFFIGLVAGWITAAVGLIIMACLCIQEDDTTQLTIGG